MAKLRIYRSLARLSPTAILAGAVVAGLLLVALSFLVGASGVTHSTLGVPREVGYLAAVNWSIGFTLFVPFCLFFMLSALRSVPRTTLRLAESGMLVDKKMDVDLTAEKSARERWHRITSRSESWLIGLVVIALAVSYYEWWDASAAPLLVDRSVGGVKEDEIDWSVAARIPGHDVNPGANALLSFLAFSAQGFFLFCLLGFFLFIYAFCELVALLRDAREKPILVLNLRTDDPRRGFQAFERIVEEILLAACAAYGVFYLSRIWNLYLHSDSQASSLWSYVSEDIARGFLTGDVSKVGKELLEAGTFDYSGSWVTLAALVLLPLSVAVPLFVLRRASVEARNTLEVAIQNGSSAALQGLDRETALARLKDVAMWPLGYPRANQLLIFGLLAVVSMFLFRIGLLYLGAALALLLKKALDALR